MSTFSLKIISTDKVFYDGKCEYLVIPTIDGEKGILYQAFFEILQNASCYQKFNQNVRSYSHDYEAHSITLRFADDASQNLLFTVYSDGVCQVNGKFVFLRSPDGNAEAIYQLLRDAVV